MPELSVNLGLDISPQAQDKNFYDIYRLYNAVKILADALDRYTGTIVPTPPAGSDLSIYGLNYMLIQNTTKVFLTAGATDIPSNVPVAIDSAGRIILASNLNGCHGFSTSAIPANTVGPIALLGAMYVSTAITPGYKYYTTATPGVISSVSGTYIVGFAIDAHHLFVNPR